MGCNFYLRENACPACGRCDSDDALHIGKSSAGWCFALHVIPEQGLNTLSDWRERWSRPGVGIFDEYGKRMTAAEMEDRITRRSWERKATDRFDHASNSSQPGPNGLVRSAIDGRHCVGHGEGTWDYIAGEFS